MSDTGINKFGYSFNEESYHGSFDTREEALAEASSDRVRTIWTGRYVSPMQPEDWFDASDWLEHVSCQDEYASEAAQDWECSTKGQREELETEVRKLMAAWLDRHDLRPKFFTVEDVQRHDSPTFPSQSYASEVGYDQSDFTH